MLSWRFGLETNIAVPLNLGQPVPESSFHYLVGPEVRIGSTISFGLSLDLPVNDSLSVRADVFHDFISDRDRDATTLSRGGEWGVVIGPHLDLGWPHILPLYVEAAVGGAAVSSDPSQHFDAIGETELGLRMARGCGLQLEVGARAQLDSMMASNHAVSCWYFAPALATSVPAIAAELNRCSWPKNRRRRQPR